MRVLVWQWGRYGAGPTLAALLADAFGSLPSVDALLSLSSSAEILREANAPHCDLPIQTYAGVFGLGWRVLQAPLLALRLMQRMRALRPRFAVCAMPGALDLLMVMALRPFGVPIAVIVHDAESHPGDRIPLLLTLQKRLLHRAAVVIALSNHVADGLRANGSLPPLTPIVLGKLPALSLAPVAPPAAHPGPRRVLYFGRLRDYKGLDLLADALRVLGARPDMEVRVVGQGQESAALAALRSLPGVTVENRWVPEAEIAMLLDWSDIVVLPYREASQSGVVPTVLAAGRRVVATRVGGLAEQLAGEPLARLCEPDARSLAAALADTLQEGNNDVRPPVDARAAWRAFAAGILAAFAGESLDNIVGLADAR